MGTRRWLAAALTGMLALPLWAGVARADGTTVGTQGPAFDTTGSAPTGEKPESKVWFHDGTWFAVLYGTSGEASIWRLDADHTSWTDTGVTIASDETDVRSDVLADGDDLYVATHRFTTNATPTATGESRLYAFTYDDQTNSYVSADTANGQDHEVINQRQLEALTIDKDSTGTLWATWVQGDTVGASIAYHVYVAHEQADGTWASMALPNTTVSADDISALRHARNGDLVVLFSQQPATDTGDMLFSTHHDGDAADAWSTPAEALPWGDDHINLKTLDTADGKLYATVKTGLKDAESDEIRLLVGTPGPSGWSWTNTLVATAAEDWTRTIVVLQQNPDRIHVFGSTPETQKPGVPGRIMHKVSPMDTIAFGPATVAIDNGGAINNTTSTRQPVDASTGMLVVASSDPAKGGDGHYWFAYENLAPPVASFTTTPSSGAASLDVQFTDTSTGRPTSWSWDFGDGATSTATNPTHSFVDPGTYTATLTVTNANGTDSTTHTVTVTAPATTTTTSTSTTSTTVPPTTTTSTTVPPTTTTTTPPPTTTTTTPPPTTTTTTAPPSSGGGGGGTSATPPAPEPAPTPPTTEPPAPPAGEETSGGAATSPSSGYALVAGDGTTFGFGSDASHPSGALPAGEHAVAATPSGDGQWLVTATGKVYAFGDALSYGDAPARLSKPIVGIAATPSGKGYWLVASDGGVFSFGDAPFEGSTGALHLVAPVVGILPTTSGKGYWLVASDGGVFTFGDAPFLGSTGALHLAAPIVGIVRTPDGNGYWLVASDGGVFTFGSAHFYGSTGALRLAAPISGMLADPDGAGYWLIASDGGVFAFDAPFLGSAAGHTSSGAFPLDAE